MKQNLTALILAASMALSLCACAGGETGGSSSAPPSSSSPSASSQADAPPREDVSSSSSPEPSAEGEDAFSFAALETLQFCFSSGAGG